MLLRIDLYTLEIYVIHLFLIRIIISGFKFKPYSYGIWMLFVGVIVIVSLSYVIATAYSNIKVGIIEMIKEK